MPTFLPTLTTLLRLFTLLSLLTISSLAGLLYTYQGKLIYPSNLPPGSREDKTRPDAFELPFEEQWLNTPDGETLQAWWIGGSGGGGGGGGGEAPDDEKRRSRSSSSAAAKGQQQQQQSRVIIIMFQANAGNTAHRLPIADVLFRKVGCEVVMFSYRGYGLSSGTPSEKGIQIDAQVVLDWVRRRIVEDQEEEEDVKIVLYGQSLGGAVAISTASRNTTPRNTTRTTPGISALILENTFTSIPALIPTVLPPARFFTFLCRETWHSNVALSSVDARRTPILFLSGAKDELVPPGMMRELWGVATAKAKGRSKKGAGEAGVEWLLLEKGTHNDTCMQKGYWGAIASFLSRRCELRTEFARRALEAGYTEERMSSGPQAAAAGENEGKEELVAEGSSSGSDGEEGYGDDWAEEKGTTASSSAAAAAAARAASAAGVRKRGGAQGAGPADVVVDEEIETDGVRSARLQDL